MVESSADLRTAEKIHEYVIFCFFPLQHISAVQTSWTRLAERWLFTFSTLKPPLNQTLGDFN